MKRKSEIEFLFNGLKIFLDNGDLESMNIATKFGQISVSRKRTEQEDIHAIGFHYEEDEESEDGEE